MRAAIFGTGCVGLVSGTCRVEGGMTRPRFDVDQGGIDGRGRSILPE